MSPNTATKRPETSPVPRANTPNMKKESAKYAGRHLKKLANLVRGKKSLKL
jgi:hypothetical protein